MIAKKNGSDDGIAKNLGVIDQKLQRDGLIARNEVIAWSFKNYGVKAWLGPSLDRGTGARPPTFHVQYRLLRFYLFSALNFQILYTLSL